MPNTFVFRIVCTESNIFLQQISQIHIHGTNVEELHRHVPKTCLPKEYGGYAGPVADHWGM
jgi:hypothetical protein